MDNLIDVLGGYFTYSDDKGTVLEVPFYVHTLPEPASDAIDVQECKDRRVDDANNQLMDAWTRLQAESYSNIHYKDVQPSPFF